MTSKHQRVGGGRKTYAEGELEALKKQACDLKRQGYKVTDIAARIEASESSIKRWTKGVNRGRVKDQKAKLGRVAYKEQQRIDRERNSYKTPDDDQGPEARILFMPTNPDSYLTTGTNPDPKLVRYAARVLDTWVTDKAKGTLTTVPPLQITKAAYVVASSFTIWDYTDFLSDRQSWRTVRQFTGTRAEDIANTVGISFASISRYEKASRNPDAQYHRRLHEAYKDMLDQFLLNLEWKLLTSSYIETLPEDHDPEALLDKDDIVWWAVTDSPSLEDIDITHITHLHQMRQLMPQPTWREPSVWNFGLQGYGNQLVTV